MSERQAAEHYPTAAGACACGEQFPNTWSQRAHMRSHAKRDTSSSTDLFPSDVDVPTSMLLPTSVTLSLDSSGRHNIFPPNARYLRDLAKVASELADRVADRDAAAGGAA